MKKYIILILVICLVSFVYADRIYLNRDGNNGFVILEDNILNRGVPSIVLECNVSYLDTTVVNTPQGRFNLLTIPRFQGSSKIGYPRIPVMNKLIEIPFGAKVNVKVLNSTVQEYSLKDLGIKYPLMPRQPSHPKDGSRVPFAYVRSAYSKDGYYQEKLADIKEVGILRYIRLALLKVSPVAYNPVKGKIKVYTNIRIEINLPDTDLRKTSEIYNRYYSPYFEWVRSKVLAPKSLLTLSRDGDLTKYPVKYLIIADRMFASDLEPFVAWKIKKGFIVKVAYTDEIGNSTSDIKNYIASEYKNATKDNPAPSFVLFVGDTDQIPAFRGEAGYHVTDLYYVTVTADILPDIYKGRFSANNSSELIPQIEKTLMYEQYRFPDPSFLKDVVLVAGWDWGHAVEWGWPQINYGVKYYFNEKYGLTDVHVFLSSGSHQNEREIINLVSNGTAYVNYTAHGSPDSWADPSFEISDINGLMNKGRYPLVVGNCCLTNKFEVKTCFGEAWLRAKDKGAIGYIGGSNSTYWDEDLWWGNGYYSIAHPNDEGLPPKREETGDGAYDGAFLKGFFTNDGMILAGNLAVQESSSPRKKYYWEVYHLMGDPSLMVYWGIPKDMNVVVPSSVNVYDKYIKIKAEKGAYVGITMNGKLVGAAVFTNDEIKVPVKFETSGTATIVITKKNRKPYETTINVK